MPTAQKIAAPDTLRDAMASLAPKLADAARRAEEARRPDDECMAAIERTGLFALFVPKSHGGHERPLSEVFDLVTTLGEGCTSTAWVASFYVAHSWIASLFPAEARQEFFAERPWVRAPGPFPPNGTGVAAPGGYRLTGRWKYATGITHADCEFISQHAGTILDVEDVVPGGSYTLEVSSPGVERKLTKPADFERFTGQKIKLVLREPFENQKRWEGTLAGFSGGTITLEPAPGKPLQIALSNVAKANLKFEW